MGIRVVLAEDSAVTREYLVALLDDAPGIDLVGVATNGVEAVEIVTRLRPDIVLMDVHMPGLDGYQATRKIMETAPTRIVMASASLARNDTAILFDALNAGAITAVEKPMGPGHSRQMESVRTLLKTIELMAQVAVVRRWPASSAAKRIDRGGHNGAWRKLRLIAIGASTGGPATLATILAALPADLNVPILIVQHFSSGFLDGLVNWLGHQTPLRVRVARNGDRAAPGTVYFAPEDAHMGVDADATIRLHPDAPEEGFRPSVSFLLRSVANAFGPAALGIVLTGMGRDGATGLKKLRDAGAVTIAQSAESCVVFGMPAEAIRLGAAEHVLAPQRIAETVHALAGTSASTHRRGSWRDAKSAS